MKKRRRMTRKMSKKGDDYIDDNIHHAILFEQYKTGQARKILRYVRQTNNSIADYVRTHSFETKKQYGIGAREVKRQIAELTTTLYRVIVKDVKKLIKAEGEFVSAASPVELNTDFSRDTVLKEILFDTFSDTETIQSFLEMLGERIFKVWDGQFRVAYMTGMDSRAIIKAVLG
jgi:hypothetical protein